MVSCRNFFLNDLAIVDVHLHFAKEIYPGFSLIPLLLPFHITNGDKPSANSEKLAGNNKRRKPKDKTSIDRGKSAGNNKRNKPKNKPSDNGKKLSNDNNEDLDNKPSADMKILVGEKNIEQDENAAIYEKAKAKVGGIVIEGAVISNLYNNSGAMSNL